MSGAKRFFAMKRAFRGLLIFAAMTLIAGPAWSESPSSPALARLKSDLLSNPSATQVLTKWCGDLGLASPAIIRAERDAAAVKAPTAEIVALLAAEPNEVLRYRHVRLMCGTHLLSEADNWYRPSQLTPDMNRILDETDTPFGNAVRPLNFHRKTLDAAPTADPLTPLRVRALLLTASQVPFSLVIENYSRDLVAGPP
jgi:chorismate-pyruvate lyase